MKITQMRSEESRFRSVSNWFRGKWEPWFILFFAFFYYASYYRSGLNLGGEGGTAGVLALRLLEGQRPFADTFIGYNVLWFYPVAGLFKIFGVNYLLLKIYFFVLCTITGVLATILVRRVTESSLLAIGTGLVVVMIPGMQFRNYLPLLAVLNMTALFHAFVFSHKTFWKKELRFVFVGIVLGLTYLIRIDVGVLVTLVLLALLMAAPWYAENGLLRGFYTTVIGAVTIGIFAFLMHVPFIWDAHHRGFQDHFFGQYSAWSNYIKGQANSLLLTSTKKTQPLHSDVSKPNQTTSKASAQGKAVDQKATLSRPPLSDIAQRKLVRLMFALGIYAPIPIAFLILIGMGCNWIVSAWKRNFEACRNALGVLIALGCSLVLFPQYFFFRPDLPHLSEFMVPFVVTMVLACFQAVRIAIAKKYVLPWIYAAVLLFFCISDAIAHLSNGFRNESSGSIAAIRHRGKEFIAENGVRVFVKPADYQKLQNIYSTITNHSKPADWVICYPYLPTVNFMTNRKSYEYNLYVDNATTSDKFDTVTIGKLLSYQPAVIVIRNSAVNRNEVSRFKNWAANTYEFIANNYQLVSSYGDTEIYVKKKE